MILKVVFEDKFYWLRNIGTYRQRRSRDLLADERTRGDLDIYGVLLRYLGGILFRRFLASTVLFRGFPASTVLFRGSFIGDPSSGSF